MLLATHIALGAVIGRRAGTTRGAALGGLLSHAVADGIGHNDSGMSPEQQGVLAGVTLAVIAAVCREEPRVLVGACAGGAPDAEVAAHLLAARRGRRWPMLFVSHVSRQGKQGHPYRFPGPSVPVVAELAGVLGVVCWLSVTAGRARRRR